MNKLVLFLLLTTCFSFSQEIKDHNPNYDFKTGEYHYLFGDDVKFRQFPAINAEVIELLKIGTKVQIVDKTDEKLNYNGIESPFYKVKYKNKVGYILGGLIALEKKELKTK